MTTLVDMTLWDGIEWLSVLFSLLYIWLVAKENILCWPFGILSSILGVALFFNVKLYSEAILYGVYAIAGVYGWSVWAMKGVGVGEDAGFPVINWESTKIITAVISALFVGLGIGFLMNRHTDAAHPWIDAQTTAFSLLATYLEIHKVLFAWILWIILNGTAIWLYASRGLNIYAGLMVVYFILSFFGYRRWKQRLEGAL